MLPSASALASRREERVRKAFSVDHHGPGNARLSHGAIGIYGEWGDSVLLLGLRAGLSIVLDLVKGCYSGSTNLSFREQLVNKTSFLPTQVT